MPAPLWSILLAGGAGRRLATVTGGVPKQFWSPDGSPSLIELTANRVGAFIPPSRTITVVDRTHRRYVSGLVEQPRLGRVLYQPGDRGTAAGVMIGLSAVVDAAPDALVLLTPADHGVARPEAFSSGVQRAAAWIEAGKNEIVLFGVPPSAALGDYGWIMPGDAAESSGADLPRPVAKFVEKPTAYEAVRLMASGAVWNTMVLVARAGALVEMYRQYLPDVLHVFVEVSRSPKAHREALLAAHYPYLPSADFSRDLLTEVPGLAVLVWPAEIGWSDLGTPDRLQAWRAGEPLKISA